MFFIGIQGYIGVKPEAGGNDRKASQHCRYSADFCGFR